MLAIVELETIVAGLQFKLQDNMATPENLGQIASKISLILDNPESVKLQIKQIILAQKELRIFRKDLSATVSNISAEQSAAIQSQKDCQPYLKLQEERSQSSN